jgi:hypothetical protein
MHLAANSLNLAFYVPKIVSVQVLCDEETCGGKSFEVDAQEGEVLSCGGSAFFKDVYFFEGLLTGAADSFACAMMFVL